MHKAWYIVIVLIIALLIQQCSGIRSADKLINEIAAYSDSASIYKLKVNGLEVEVASNSVLNLQSEFQLKSLLSKNDSLSKLISKFKKLNSVVVVSGGVQLVHDTIELPVKIPCDFSASHFRQKTPLFKITGIIRPENVIIDTIAFYDKQSIVFGEKKTGLFKRETTVDVIHSNPYFYTTKIGAYSVAPKKKWYNQWWTHVAEGFIIGFATQRQLSK